MTIISRLQLDHPTLGAAGGVALHDAIEEIYLKIGDNANARFFTQIALLAGNSVDFEHNFKCAFSDLSFEVYSYDGLTGQLTRLTDSTSPTLSEISLAATPGFLTTKIRATNNSIASQSIAVVVTQATVDYTKVSAVTTAVSGNVTAKPGRLLLVNTSAIRTITLPDPATTKQVIWVKDVSGLANTNNITVARFGTEKIENVAASYLINSNYASVALASDGTDWFIV